jgi:hypothetical protein
MKEGASVMKRVTTLLLVLVLGAPLASMAQEEKRPMTDEQLDRMQERLELSDEQVSEMRQIRDGGGSNKDIRAVLTEEQKARAKDMKKEGKAKGEKKGKGEGEKKGKKKGNPESGGEGQA